jgi:CheY-like chemotaxis protein
MAEQSVFLLVDDDVNDIAMVRRAFVKAKVLNPLFVVQGGEAAIDYLSGSGRYANREEFPLPSLVLLDLKMRGVDGFEVLRWIRHEPVLKKLRVVILSGADAMADVNRAYRMGANSFLIKPVDFERFVEVSQALAGYWLWMDKGPEVLRPLEEKNRGAWEMGYRSRGQDVY